MIKSKGAIFDLDGTILDTMPAWDHLGVDFLKRYQLLPVENMREELKPLGFAETGLYFKKRFDLPQSAEEITNEILEMIADQYRFIAPLKPCVKEYLEWIKNDGIRMCVATATNKELALAALKRLNIAHYFEFIITCDEVGKGKDSPDIYLKAAEKLGLPVKQTAVFEDALHCIVTAKKVGFEVIGVYDESAKTVQNEIMELCDTYLFTYNLGGVSE